MRSIGFEPIVPKHGFTIHRNNHSATIKTSHGRLELPSGWLTATYSTLKLVRHLSPREESNLCFRFCKPPQYHYTTRIYKIIVYIYFIY